MRQTLALIVDAYRELNYKKLFWVTLIVSAVVVFSFLGVRIDEHGLILFGFEIRAGINTGSMERPVFYRLLFLELGVNYWLTWAATILALISTVGIFPDLITGGSIDLYLSKPISRLRLFLTKYFTGLLFVALQVAAFSLASFLVLAIRGEGAICGVFLAVPIVLLFYSYLYCVSVLIGIITRSTLTAILLTCLLWIVILAVHSIETRMLIGKFKDGYVHQRLERNVIREEEELAKARSTESQTLRKSRVGFHQKKLDAMRDSMTENAAATASDEKWHRRLYVLATIMPKTTETVALMRRWLVSSSQLYGSNPEYERGLSDDEPMPLPFGMNTDDVRAARDADKEVRARPVSWVIGTSFGFEVVIVSIAAWIFCRRDY